MLWDARAVNICRDVFVQLCMLHAGVQQHYVPMPWTMGVLERPLGNARLQTVRLVATLLGTGLAAVSDELMRLGTINVLLVSNWVLFVNILFFYVARFYML